MYEDPRSQVKKETPLVSMWAAHEKVSLVTVIVNILTSELPRRQEDDHGDRPDAPSPNWGTNVGMGGGPWASVTGDVRPVREARKSGRCCPSIELGIQDVEQKHNPREESPGD
jgi:hypothetical protein